MPSNLPNIQKENWALNEVVMPTDTNNWGSSINKLTTAIPIYASTGDFYTVQSYENNVISLTPLTYIDGSQNQIPLTYIDGMNIVFKSTFNNQSKCSININGLGVKQIKNIDNTLLSADKIKQGYYVNLKYDLLQDCFYLNSLSITNEMGGGLEVCDIGTALYVDETKGLRRYLNGQIVDINANTQAFLDRLKEITALHPSLLCTEDEWQTAHTMNVGGYVDMFVIDETAGTIRLPNYPDYVIAIGDTIPVVGNGMGLGFDTGVAQYPHTGITAGDGTYSSAFIADVNSYGLSVGSKPSNFGLATGKTAGVTTDPTKSGLEVSVGSGVKKLRLKYFIQIATGAETENNITNEIELNNPYTLFDCKYTQERLYNVSWLLSNGQWNSKAVYVKAYEALRVEANPNIEQGDKVTLPSGTEYVKRGLSVVNSTEAYTDYDYVLNTSDETFRLPIKTNLAGGKAVVGNGLALGLTEGTNDFAIHIAGGAPYDSIMMQTSTGYGTSVGATTEIKGIPVRRAVGITSDSTKSGLELAEGNLFLYFYVGETVQNANLIDAGRIAEVLGRKLDTPVRYVVEKSDPSLLPSWYVVYNDGWIEQGSGTAISNGTISLLKSFSNTNYAVMGAGFAIQDIGSLNVTQKLVDRFTVWSEVRTSSSHSWWACGY